MSIRPSLPALVARRCRPAVRAGALLLALAAAAAPLAGDVVNRVVLRVNDRIATLHEFEERRAETERELLRRQDLPLQQRRELLNNLDETVFRDLYEELLLLSRADQIDVRVSESDVDAALARMRENFGLDTDEDFAAALAQTGMTRDQLRDQVRRQQRIQTVLGREVQAKIVIDEEVLRRYYRDHPEDFQVPEQLRLQEIVVLDDSGLTPEERAALAAEIREELLAARPLAEAAAERSQDGATSGAIDIGWVSRGDLAPDLASAIWDLPAGSISEPVASRGGLHLVEVQERREATLRPFSEVADQIRAFERQRRFADAYTEYLDRLEREAYIQADPPETAKNFRAAPARPEDVAGAMPAETAAAGEANPTPPAEGPDAPVADPDAGSGDGTP